MQLTLSGVFLPDTVISLHINSADTIQGYHIKLSDRFVVLRRVSGCHNDPAFRDLLITKHFPLQKLQHGRRQCLRHTVDLIDKKDSLVKPGLLHPAVYTGNDLTHRVFGDGICLSSIRGFPDKRQSNRTLSGMMSNIIGNQSDLTLSGNLLHDLRFTDSGRSDQKDRSLAKRRNTIIPQIILIQICLYGMFNFIFCFFNVHRYSPFCLHVSATALHPPSGASPTPAPFLPRNHSETKMPFYKVASQSDKCLCRP